MEREENENVGDEEKRKSIKYLTGYQMFIKSASKNTDTMRDVDVRWPEGSSHLGRNSTLVAKMWKNISANHKKEWCQRAQQRREEVDVGQIDLEKERHTCLNCQKSFKKLADMKYHRKGCGECVCPECGKTFAHNVKLKRHLNIHTTSYECSHCKKCFANQQALNRHIRLHTGEKLKCTFCTVTFVNRANLARHIKNKHQ